MLTGLLGDIWAATSATATLLFFWTAFLLGSPRLLRVQLLLGLGVSSGAPVAYAAGAPVPAAVLGILGILTAARALTHDAWGEWGWLTALGTAILGAALWRLCL